MALIKEADISLGKGLNILSGETGAGKSILLGSIAVALGLQNFKGFAREDADYALSELVFVIENEEQRQALLELEIPVEDGEVIISRRLSKGRTTSKINGETVPVSMVRKAGTLLIDIHGQHENQSLLHIRKHLELLDDFAGEKLALAKEKYKARYQEYGELKKELDQAQLDNATRAKEMDFLSFEIGGDHKTHFILPGYHIIFQQTEIEFKLYIQKIQIHQSLLHLFCKTLCRFLSDDSEVFCFFLQLFFAGGKTAFSLRQVSFVVFKYCKTLLFFFTVCLDFLDRITVFRLQMVDQIKPLLCLFQRFFIDIQLICISGDLPVKII